MRGPRGVRGDWGSRPPWKITHYKYPEEYWSGPPGKLQSYPTIIQCLAIYHQTTLFCKLGFLS